MNKKILISSLFIGLLGILMSCGLTATKVVNNNQFPNVPRLYGVNAVGGEILWKGEGVPVVSGTNYIFPTKSDLDYLKARGINFARLTFSYEYLQPVLSADFPDSEYNRKFTECVNYATSLGINVAVAPHGGLDAQFWKYKGNALGSNAYPISSFVDFWRRMTLKFISNSLVAYDFGNEYNSSPSRILFDAEQQAINAVRATGSRQMLFLSGAGWQHAWTIKETWTDSENKISNIQGFQSLKDPLNNSVLAFHEYAGGSGGSGATTDVYNATIIADHIKVGIDWARANNWKIYIGETGASSTNPLAQTAIQNAYDMCNNNGDVCLGVAFWAYGNYSFWGKYQFTLAPPSNNYYNVDEKWNWISPYFPSNNKIPMTLPVPVVDAGTPILDSGIADASSADAGASKLIAQVRQTADLLDKACFEIDLKNNTTSPQPWTSVRVDLSGAVLQSVWQTTASVSQGISEFSALSWATPVKPQSKVSFGFCETAKPKNKPQVLEIK